MNQTTQMHAVFRELSSTVVGHFSPYYGDALVDLGRRLGLLEFTIGGNRHWAKCLEYFEAQDLTVDVGGKGGPYDLVVTSSDVVVPRNVWNVPLVAVQEGILDPEGVAFGLVRRFRFLPRWLAGTAATGLSEKYDRFCAASHGYRDHLVSRGADPDRVVVTGIPNFDDCERFRQNAFPHHGHVLVCTSDARETMKTDDRRRFIERAVEIARGRRLVFKLHPNEDDRRASAEIAKWAPRGSFVFRTGSAEEMIANADVVVCQYSSTAFVALALGKEVHSYWPTDELRRLLPLQNRCAARNIASVCRDVLASYAPAKPRGGSADLAHATWESAA